MELLMTIVTGFVCVCSLVLIIMLMFFPHKTVQTEAPAQKEMTLVSKLISQETLSKILNAILNDEYTDKWVDDNRIIILKSIYFTGATLCLDVIITNLDNEVLFKDTVTITHDPKTYGFFIHCDEVSRELLNDKNAELAETIYKQNKEK